MRIILASKSPRRKEILENLGVDFDIITADADESSEITDPCALVMNLAEIKNDAVVSLLDKDDCLIISCDTLVYAEGEFLGKPVDKEDARRMMKMLSGKRHQVVSGICVRYGGKKVSAASVTQVCFDELSDEELESYISTSEPYDKAGGYAVQGLAGVFVKGIEGDYYNVVGLPVNLLYNTLKKEFGIDLFNIP